MDRCEFCQEIVLDGIRCGCPGDNAARELARIQKFMDGVLVAPAPHGLCSRVAAAIHALDSVIRELLTRISELENALAVSRIYVGQIVEDPEGGSPEQHALAVEHLELINRLVP